MSLHVIGSSWQAGLEARGYCLVDSFVQRARCRQWSRLLQEVDSGGRPSSSDPAALQRAWPFLWQPLAAVTSLVEDVLWKGTPAGRSSRVALQVSHPGCRPAGRPLPQADLRAVLFIEVPPSVTVELCGRGAPGQVRRAGLMMLSLLPGAHRAARAWSRAWGSPAVSLEVGAGSLLVYQPARCEVDLGRAASHALALHFHVYRGRPEQAGR